MEEKRSLVSEQGGQVAVQQRPVDVLKTMLKVDSVKEQFSNALGAHRDTFIASIIDLYTSDKQLQTCKPADVVAQALKAASLKLPINKALGFAYIVVYNNNVKVKDEQGRDQWIKVPTPTFIPGYKGYIQLAMRTGKYETINADVVYDGEIGKVDKLSGAIKFDGVKKSDKIIGYFCYYKLTNGFKKTLYMSVEDMAKYAKRYSPSLGKGTSVEDLIKLANTEQAGKQVGWMGNFNDMALKTVTRRLLSKFGYLSVEMQGAISDEIAVDEKRNELIADNANTITLDESSVSFEEVASPKPTTAPQTEAPTNDAEETPDY